MAREFCVECRKYTHFNVVEEEMTSTINEVDYTYMGKAAYCNACGAEVYPGEICDYNIDAFNKAREEHEKNT